MLSADSTSQFQLRYARTAKLNLPKQTVDTEKLKNQYPFIGNKIVTMVNAQPKIIVGQDNWPVLKGQRTIHGSWNGPALTRTLLGWVLHGNLNYNKQYKNIVCTMSCSDHKEKDDLDILHELVKEQWKMDTVIDTTKKVTSPEDKRAQKILDETMKRVGKRYETGLLWKNENMILPESKKNAMIRLKCNERKMDKNKAYGEIYSEKFEELERKGYIRKLTIDQAQQVKEKTWYLPHFGTVNPNKPNKLRIVFDASAKSNGVSLNDCLVTGPDLYNSLQKILLNFRVKKYAFVADIKEMFLQVKIRPEDRCAQRLLWRGMDRNREPDVYEIDVVFFGSTCGPCLAQEAKNRNAKEFEQHYPEAVKAIVESHYMDDYLGNADTLDEAKKLVYDVIYIHKQASFIICNWTANKKEILKEIDPILTIEGAKNIKENENIERILGVFWQPDKDIFSFKTKFHKIETDILENLRRPTKREVLKVVMSIFDPLGFIANFLVYGKAILQDTWSSKIGWDDEIPDSVYQKWML